MTVARTDTRMSVSSLTGLDPRSETERGIVPVDLSPLSSALTLIGCRICVHYLMPCLINHS